MSDKVWMSSVFSPAGLGDRPGTHTKYYGHDWNPAEFEIPVEPDEVHAAYRRHRTGYALRRSEFPEAIAVFDEERFSKRKDLFFSGPFFAVQGKLADVLTRFDLGEGGLIPFTIYQADLETPYPGEFSLLNFGSRKNTLLPEQSPKVAKFVIEKKTGIQFWKVNDWEVEPVALSSDALRGPDLWCEEVLYNKLFMSDALAQAITAIGLQEVFALEECLIVAGEEVELGAVA